MVATAKWKSAKLDELGFVGRGKSRHRPRNAAILYGGSYPFFQTGDIKAANFYLTEFTQTYSEEGLAQSKLWKPGTLCITIAANIAESAILGIDGCFPDSVVGFVADPDKADVRFIKYYMEILKLQMQSVSRGTTQDNLSVDKLLSFDFCVPPLPLQHRIASIFSAYDELIENNQRRIRILEDMARSLYREWFVHFRYPGHDSPRPQAGEGLGVRAGFVDSPLGQIPQGWEVKKIAELLAKVSRQGKIKTQDYLQTGDLPVIDQGRELVGGYTNDADVEYSGELPVIVFGDHTRILKFIDFPFACGADGTQLLRSNDERMPVSLFYYTLSVIELSDFAYARHFKFLKEELVVVPIAEVATAFSERVDPIKRQVRILQQQSDNLRRTRDLLLPRLLSGGINIQVTNQEQCHV